MKGVRDRPSGKEEEEEREVRETRGMVQGHGCGSAKGCWSIVLVEEAALLTQPGTNKATSRTEHAAAVVVVVRRLMVGRSEDGPSDINYGLGGKGEREVEKKRVRNR